MEAVLDAAAQAVTHARQGRGPFMLVFDTYRHLEHVGPGSDFHLGYRSKEEVDSWIERDPLVKLRNRLSSQMPGWAEYEGRIDRTLAAEIEEAFEFATSSPFPCADELMTGVFPVHPGVNQP